MPIDFERHLNPQQLEAVRHDQGPLLVIAGAGSGKTRTIVHRLARLVSDGVDPESILLLTFTRKASQEMLLRAEAILGRPLTGTSGGTFHSFAFGVLRRNAALLGCEAGFTLLDRADSENLLRDIRASLEIAKGDKTFPRKNTLADCITKSRNKELSLDRLVEEEAFHLTPHLADLEAIAEAYEIFKREHGLLDYDDLLFRLEELLRAHPRIKEDLRARYRYVMVDEYQDTNRVQARLVRLLAGRCGNVMVVGDDAQSIYAFRGANVDNILDFPSIFTGAKLVRLEQNYRSTQPVLDLTNALLAEAHTKFDKALFSDRKEGPKPQVVRALSDQSQAMLVLGKVIELAKRMSLHEIAVLFRAGYQSFPLEVALKRMGLDYQKFGGIRFHEAAHVKDVLAHLRLVVNPSDMVAWRRAMEPLKGIGPKTADRIARAVLTGDDKYLKTRTKKHRDLAALLDGLDRIRSRRLNPGDALEEVLAFYTPLMPERYPDDYPKRQAGLDQLVQISRQYDTLETFLADLTLDGDDESQTRRENALVLSTVHSAKGLEWRAVMVIDLVEDRFPSRRAMAKPEDLDEERRLLYVACTRAKDELYLFAPSTVYNRATGMAEPSSPSPFLRELDPDGYDELRESFSGGLGRPEPKPETKTGTGGAARKAAGLGLCRHKIFGQGKIIAEIPPNKYRVNFPGFGLKVIVADYLELL